jgi:hypothetical protein
MYLVVEGGVQVIVKGREANRRMEVLLIELGADIGAAGEVGVGEGVALFLLLIDHHRTRQTLFCRSLVLFVHFYKPFNK